MRSTFAAACVFALAAGGLFAQPNSIGDDAKTGMDAMPPILLRSQPIEISTGDCKKRDRSTDQVRLSLLVTSDGKPRWISFLSALGNETDKKILDLVSGDEFKPAMRNGEPASTWQSIGVSFQTCREKARDKASFPSYRIISQPTQTLSPSTGVAKPDQAAIDSSAKDEPHPYQVGGDVSAPVPVVLPEAHYSNEARKKRIVGECVVSLVVDAQGMPQDPHVTQPAGYGLDEKAIDAISRYRFKPALKGGYEPVPVTVVVQLNFRLY